MNTRNTKIPFLIDLYLYSKHSVPSLVFIGPQIVEQRLSQYRFIFGFVKYSDTESAIEGNKLIGREEVLLGKILFP